MNKLLLKSLLTNAEIYRVNEKCYTVYRNNKYYNTFDCYEVAVAFALNRTNFPAEIIQFPARRAI